MTEIAPETLAARPRILIAEDDSTTASMLQTLLQRSGYEVEVVGDGPAALLAVEEGPLPDLLILDWMLPEVSGLEVCEQLRTRWDAISLPVLMLTAKTDARSISAAFAAGVSDYLTKPFLSAELRARIAAHLRIKQGMEERRRMDEHLMEREKLSALGLLVSGVAHDLNNPLAGISGWAQLLLEDETDPTRLTALRQILGEVQRCNRIVGDLLAFVRRRPAERGEVRVDEVLRRTVELRERHLIGAGIQLQLSLDADLPAVWGDEHQLQQVFLNLLINAEQALQQGGGRVLRVGAGVAASSNGRDPAGPSVVAHVYNDGPPIPPDVLPRIFEPFFTTKSSEEGTGLGLAICQRIVREHGGEMEVESGSDGTIFRVLLPGTAPGG